MKGAITVSQRTKARRLSTLRRATVMRACARAVERGHTIVPSLESLRSNDGCMCPLGALVFERVPGLDPEDIARFPTAQDAHEDTGVPRDDAEEFIEVFEGCAAPLGTATDVEKLAWQIRAGALASYGLTGWLRRLSVD